MKTILATHKLHFAVILLAAGLTLALGACGGEEESSTPDGSSRGRTGEDFSPVIAEVGDLEITQAYFDYRYENLSPQEKARYSGEGWEQRFLDYLVEETLVYLQAEEERYDLIRDVDYRLDMARRSILMKAYYEKNFQDELVVPEERIVEYYEQSPESFRMLGRALAYHIQSDSKERIEQAWAELESGEKFETVALKYSEDENTRENGGLLGWFNPDGYVLGMGFNKEFTDHVFSMERGSVSGPVQIADTWHIIRLGAKTDDEVQPLSQVHERIERTLRPIVAQEAYQDHLGELERQWGVDYFGKYNARDPRSADQLYRVAAESRNAHAKLHYYELLVEQYPDHELADEALFMAGFVASEEFADVPSAARSFRRLISEYPESEFVDEAQWMMKHLGRIEPQLRGVQLPGDAEEAGTRIQSLQD